MTNFNFIGDIAGNYDELIILLSKMPRGIPFSVGDLIDRGDDSKKVLDFFMKKGRAVKGNHEDLFVDFMRGTNRYSRDCWLFNGGISTIRSFCSPKKKIQLDNLWYSYIIEKNNNILLKIKKIALDNIDNKYIDWVESLPEKVVMDDYIVTHAPLGRGGFWNRKLTKNTKKINIFGHLGYKRAIHYKKKYNALCLDGCNGDYLWGYSSRDHKLFKTKYLSN